MKRWKVRLLLHFRGLACLLPILLTACGGGGITTPPSSPKPDFSLSVSPSSISVQQGTKNEQVSISLNPLSGFFGTVGVAVEGLPQGVTTLPPAPFSVTAGTTQQITFFVSTSVAASSYTVTFRGTSGTLSRSATLTLTVTRGPEPPSAVRSSFVRTNETPRDAVYDPIRKLVFASVPDLNQVEVFSVTDARRVASLRVPRPFGVELTPDGSRLLVGTRVNFIYATDPDRLQVVDRVTSPAFRLSRFTLPENPVATRNGSVLLVVRETSQGLLTTSTGLVQWEPATGTFTDRTPVMLGMTSPELLARSGDYSKALLADSHSAGGTVVLYDADTDTFSRKTEISGSGGISDLAANHNGTQFAVLTASEVVFLGAELQILKRQNVSLPIGTVPEGIIYSLNGRLLYVAQWSGENAMLLSVFDTQTFSVVGEVPAVRTSGVPTVTRPLAIDETAMIFGANDRGLAFVDASNPRSLPRPPPIVRLPNALDPPQGSSATPTLTTINGASFQAGPSVFFGSVRGPDVVLESSNAIRVTAPPATTPGPVNVTAVFPDGWFALAPDGFTYGPHPVHAIVSGGPPEGNSKVEMIGYGFAFDAGSIEVAVGGRQANIVEAVPTLSISPFPFPMHRLKFLSPPGSPGVAELTITTPAGSTTIPRGFHYLSRGKVFPVAGGLSQVIYDRQRNRLYLTSFSENRVEVFSLASEEFLAPVPVGPYPEGVALTSDGSLLVVANYGDNSLSLINPDNPTDTLTVPYLGGCEPLVSGITPQPAYVATSSTGKVFIMITCSGSTRGELRVLDLATLTLTTPTEPGYATLPLLVSSQFVLASTADGTKVLIADPTHSAVLWDAATDTFTRTEVGEASDAAIAADGNRFVVDFDVADDGGRFEYQPRESSFLLTRGRVFGEKLHPSGSLLYIPVIDGVDIYDVHRGRVRQRIAFPEGVAVTLDAMALDETGKRIFAISGSGLTLIELAAVPLSIGSVTPRQGSSAGGGEVVIRGSGFQNGAVVSFRDVDLVTTFVDENTLRVVTPSMPVGSVRITVANPDGEQYFLDAAFRYTH